MPGILWIKKTYYSSQEIVMQREKLQMDEQQDIAIQNFKCKICDKDFESESDQILHIIEQC